MGIKGPVPKRSEQRRRTNEPAIPLRTAVVAPKRPAVPRADPKWHPVAKRWYQSLAKSGQVEWYEPSDWAVAVLVAESMSRDLRPQVVGTTPTGEVLEASIPLKGASMSAYLRAFTSLMVTEGDRRRASVELQRAGPVDPDADRASATVTSLQSRLGG